jgi:hypothetical protein
MECGPREIFNFFGNHRIKVANAKIRSNARNWCNSNDVLTWLFRTLILSHFPHKLKSLPAVSVQGKKQFTSFVDWADGAGSWSELSPGSTNSAACAPWLRRAFHQGERTPRPATLHGCRDTFLVANVIVAKPEPAKVPPGLPRSVNLPFCHRNG